MILAKVTENLIGNKSVSEIYPELDNLLPEQLHIGCSIPEKSTPPKHNRTIVTDRFLLVERSSEKIQIIKHIQHHPNADRVLYEPTERKV